MQQKKNYSLTRYFECLGVVVSIIELTANKVSGKEVSKVKCLDSVDVPDEVRYAKSKVRSLRNRLVHNCIDFNGLKEVFDVKESASKDFAILLKVYADVIGILSVMKSFLNMSIILCHLLILFMI